jgi:hypothetical protein
MKLFKNTKIANIVMAAAAVATLATTEVSAESPILSPGVRKAVIDTLNRDPNYRRNMMRAVQQAAHESQLTYPNCPVTFQLKAKSPTGFRCENRAHNLQVEFATQRARAESCNPTTHWRPQPVVTILNSGPHHKIVRYKCNRS